METIHPNLRAKDGDSKNQPNGMLGSAKTLKREVDVDIVTDAKAVAMVEKRIRNRDRNCRRRAERTGESLPEWVGKD